MTRRQKPLPEAFSGTVRFGGKAELLKEWSSDQKKAPARLANARRIHYPQAAFYRMDVDSQIPLDCGVALFKDPKRGWAVVTPCIHEQKHEPECYNATAKLKVDDSPAFDRRAGHPRRPV